LSKTSTFRSLKEHFAWRILRCWLAATSSKQPLLYHSSLVDDCKSNCSDYHLNYFQSFSCGKEIICSLVTLVGLVWWFMVFNTPFKNISVISWRSLLLVGETRVPGENHRHWQSLSHNVSL